MKKTCLILILLYGFVFGQEVEQQYKSGPRKGSILYFLRTQDQKKALVLGLNASLRGYYSNSYTTRFNFFVAPGGDLSLTYFFLRRFSIQTAIGFNTRSDF